MTKCSFKSSKGQFCDEWLRVFGAQIERLTFEDQEFDCEILKDYFLPKLKVLTCMGTMRGIPPKSIESIRAGRFLTCKTADEWRSIDQILPRLKHFYADLCPSLNRSLALEIFPKLERRHFNTPFFPGGVYNVYFYQHTFNDDQ